MNGHPELTMNDVEHLWGNKVYLPLYDMITQCIVICVTNYAMVIFVILSLHFALIGLRPEKHICLI